MTAEKDDQLSSAPALIMYGKMLTFTRIKFETANLDEISSHLQTVLSTKDSQIPIVIDSDIEQDLPALIDLLWSWGLQPIGVVTGILDEAAKSLHLAIFPAEGKRIERIKPSKSTSKANAKQPMPSNSSLNTQDVDKTAEVYDDEIQNSEPTNLKNPVTDQQTTFVENDEQVASMIYDQVVRSGQSINHVGGDLILTNSVNAGAEVITDNSLHIYGRAQGRLVAGATGDKDARIFCQKFNPSLVSVAGVYCLNDGIPQEVLDKPVQVSYQEGRGLVFDVMSNN